MPAARFRKHFRERLQFPDRIVSLELASDASECVGKCDRKDGLGSEIVVERNGGKSIAAPFEQGVVRRNIRECRAAFRRKRKERRTATPYIHGCKQPALRVERREG